MKLTQDVKILLQDNYCVKIQVSKMTTTAATTTAAITTAITSKNAG